MPRLRILTVTGAIAWRIGHLPAPGGWPPRRFAFTQRWDDPGRLFRTSYWADSRYGCYLELLAFARPGLTDDTDFAGIIDNDDDGPRTPLGGAVPASWLATRGVARAALAGRYCDVTHSETIATLRPDLLATAKQHGAADFDLAALTDSGLRPVTQHVAARLYQLKTEDAEPLVDGLQYPSRHGQELTMWALFERLGEPNISSHLTDIDVQPLTADDPDLHRAFEVFQLHWSHT